MRGQRPGESAGMDENPEPGGAAQRSDDASPERTAVRLILVLLVLAGALAVVHMTPLRGILRDVKGLNRRLHEMGPAAPAVFVLGSAALVAVGFPRLAMCAIGGFCFGFAYGLLWSQIGTLMGAYATFLFVKWGGRGLVLRRWPRLHGLSGVFETRGLAAVIILRQIPVHNMVTNLMLGLTPLKHRTFLLGTMLGNLTEGAPVVLAGSGAIELSPGKSIAYIGGAAAILVIIWACAARYIRSSRIAEEVRRDLAAAPEDSSEKE